MTMITVNQNVNSNDLLELVKKAETQGEKIILIAIKNETSESLFMMNY
ncbi:MAG TPA: hypothetical protein V6C58_26535 [Allocoleopsis sp.]